MRRLPLTRGTAGDSLTPCLFFHGHQLTHIVNGHVMAILIDDD